MSDDVWPDVEGALRTWLRTKTTLGVGQRVFFGAPDDAKEADYPMITISRVGGGADGSDAPIDLPLIQFDVWAPLRRKDIALEAVNALRGVLSSVRSPTAVTANVVLYGAEVNTVVYLSDPADNRPRYSVTAQVTARSI